METKTSPLRLREIVLNTRKPTILKNFRHQWKCFETGLSEWCELYDKYRDEELPHWESMNLNETNEPQWERKRKMHRMSAKEFLQQHSKNNECNHWTGLNYKRRNELPDKCTEGVDFGCFGFPEMTDDCTFWLSSKGANTPCHYDTYGCNIVVQVFGRKSWLLFPPNTPELTTTRIPYEESSVYCLQNFYAPNFKQSSQFNKLKGHSYHCILEPNDVLIVPKHWWHFVEALDISLSVNAWIPLACDVDNQIEECIVKHIVDKHVKNANQSIKEYVMNPNQLSATATTTDEELFKVLNYLVRQKTTSDSQVNEAKKSSSLYQYRYLLENDINALTSGITDICEVSLMTGCEWENFIKTNSTRCGKAPEINRISGADDKPLSQTEEALLNSICSPHIVELIKEDFLKRCNESALYVDDS